ncbi:MAG: hypothetical protein M1829_000214 [Trizodia sp. TS-e1964]|nr:MAG: hypothetical protein M1829_000214 [Trizodia sp. TS-e1964]
MLLSKAMLSLVAGVLYLGQVDAFWRLPCTGRAGVARMDPLVNHGSLSDHAHVVHGGSGFSMTSDANDLLKSDCTSCAVKQDKSAYWTPALYFQSSDGKTTLVNQVGGMLAYYLFGEGYGANPKAFPNGFKMLAGDKTLRNFTWPVPDPPKSDWHGDETSQFALSQKALGFNCLDYTPGKTPEPSLFRHFMPEKSFLDANCKNGLRLELMFPSCWNGNDLDSPNHKSHMAYPSLVNTGDCPPGFGTRLVSLFYETIWDTYAFRGQSGQFILSSGDTTGYGYHGDFIAAWEDNFLQKAVDTCTNPSGKVEDCPLFNLQSESQQGTCKFNLPDAISKEDTKGPRNGLPGSGPGEGNVVSSFVAAASSSIAPATDARFLKAAVSAESSPPPPMSLQPTTSSTLSTLTSVSLASIQTATTLIPSTLSAPPTSSAPTSTEPASTHPPIISTIYSTKGNEVWEIFVEEQTVTVTMSMTATQTSTVSPQKRALHHLQRHAHAHGRAHRH